MSGSLNIELPASISQYTSLVPSQNQNQPNFMATIAASVQPFADISAVIASFSTDFDLNTAVGSQLDTVGLWVGVTRFLSEPVNSYFSFNTSGLGFNQGAWFATGDPTTGIVSLDDTTYEILLQARIISNHWNGTVESAYDAWNTLFGIDPLILTTTTGIPITAVSGDFTYNITVNSNASKPSIAIQDMGNMQMAFVLIGPQPNALVLALFEDGELNLAPAGIYVYLCVPSVYPGGVVTGTPLFGFDAENTTVSGLDNGAWVEIVGGS